MTVWRLILDGEAHGAWNMGVDEALLASAIDTGRPALRLYRWSGPWLSLGYGQSVDDDRRARCEEAGVGWVRRVSGGRAVLHGCDLTYALAAREAQLPAGLRASYDLVARALLGALRSIGVSATAAPARARGSAGPPGGLGAATRAAQRPDRFDCFAQPAGREICAQGGKLAGSAQRRAAGGVLQHGSIRLRPDPPAAQRACSLVGGAATSLAELGADPSPEALQEACAKSFAAVLGAVFELSAPTESERGWADFRVRSHRRDPNSAPLHRPQASSRQPLDDR